MTVSLSDLNPVPLGGVTYRLRTPDVYDPARARRFLTRQRVRRPALEEFRVAALAGVAALADAVGDPAEGKRQQAVLEDWYRLAVPHSEDEIDEPDIEARAAALARLEADRRGAQLEIVAEAQAIEANLERHWSPYAELVADRGFWDDVSRIDIVRLLLVDVDGRTCPRDDDGLVTQAAYKAIPPAHRLPLATAGFRLIAPDETQRKN